MNKLIVALLICIFTLSCESDNNLEKTYTDWNVINIQYFNQMKDSSDYLRYNIPASRGGYSFYYKILSPGMQTAEIIADTSTVKINCRGKFVTGEIFYETYTESSVLIDSTAKPVNVRLNLLIRGFAENLKLMKIGEVRRMVLPQELGYGVDTGRASIPPYSVTIWDLQLVAILD